MKKILLLLISIASLGAMEMETDDQGATLRLLGTFKAKIRHLIKRVRENTADTEASQDTAKQKFDSSKYNLQQVRQNVRFHDQKEHRTYKDEVKKEKVRLEKSTGISEEQKKSSLYELENDADTILSDWKKHNTTGWQINDMTKLIKHDCTYLILSQRVYHEPNVTKHDLLLLFWNELEVEVKEKIKNRHPNLFPEPDYVFSMN